MTSQQGIVRIVMETPCYGCHRLARYTAYHRATDRLLERLAAPITHSDVHEIVWTLEDQATQAPVGQCACGAPGQETTSAEFSAMATREDLDYVAPDLCYEVCSLDLDGKRLWDRDGEGIASGQVNFDKALDPPLEKCFAAAEARTKVWAECKALTTSLLKKQESVGAQAYVRAKAQLYQRLGAEKFRRQDALGKPDDSLTPPELTVVTTGMSQLAEGQGFNHDQPLENVGIGGAYALVETLHFQVVDRRAWHSLDGSSVIDELHCQHLMNSERHVTIFNRVVTGQESGLPVNGGGKSCP